MSLWTWARVDREYRILRSRRRSRHLRRVHEECRRGGSRLGVSPVQVVDMQRVQVGALTAAAYAQSRRRRSCPVSLQNCGTMRRAVAGGGGGKAAKAASVLAETQTETQAEKVWQARLKAGECLVCCGHWHGLGVAGARTGSASAGGAGTGASGSKSGSGSGSNGGSGGGGRGSGRGSGRDGGNGRGGGSGGGGVELQQAPSIADGVVVFSRYCKHKGVRL